MPELPDVEVFKGDLDATSLQVTIGWEANPHKLPDSFLLFHRRKGERCPRGNGKIRMSKAAGQTAYYWLACQPKAR